MSWIRIWLLWGAMIAACTATAEPIKILALGDSYTIGADVAEELRWPEQLAELLQDQDYPKVDIDYIARNGWTTRQLLRGIDEAQLNSSYDFVTLQIGVNDQYRGATATEFSQALPEVLDRAATIAGNPESVIVLAIPDYGLTPFASASEAASVADEITAFNKVLAEEARRRSMHYVSLDAMVSAAGNDPSLIAGGGPHFSGKMYARWAQAILPIAESVLSNKEHPDE